MNQNIFEIEEYQNNHLMHLDYIPDYNLFAAVFDKNIIKSWVVYQTICKQMTLMHNIFQLSVFRGNGHIWWLPGKDICHPLLVIHIISKEEKSKTMGWATPLCLYYPKLTTTDQQKKQIYALWLEYLFTEKLYREYGGDNLYKDAYLHLLIDRFCVTNCTVLFVNFYFIIEYIFSTCGFLFSRNCTSPWYAKSCNEI